MKKIRVIGIIVAVILIGIVSVVFYSNSFVSNKDTIPAETEKPTNATGRHFTVELKESVSVSENP